MNENQHDANVALSRARGRFNIARGEYAYAVTELRSALTRLMKAIAADPDSWSGTPGIEKTNAEMSRDSECVIDVTAGEAP